MGGKAKWRKTKRVVGQTAQGAQPPAKQHFKKERCKTRDAKRRRMGEAGEEDEDEADGGTDGAKKEDKQTKDTLTRTSSRKGRESSSKGKGQASMKPSTEKNEKEITSQEPLEDPKTTELLHAEVTEFVQEANGIEESIEIHTPQVMVTDLDKDLDSPLIEGLQKPTGDETLEEELRKATEEECPQTEILETQTIKGTSLEISEELHSAQKSTQTDAVNINNVEKPVKFFISDDSDSDTAVFVDAHQAASNGECGQLQSKNVQTDLQKPDEGIEFSAVIDVKGESTVEVTFEGEDIEFGIKDASEPHDEASETVDQPKETTTVESPAITQLIDVEQSESPKPSAVQKAQYFPYLAQPVKTETQKLYAGIRRPHGQTKFPFDNLIEGDNISRSSASDSVDSHSVTRSSISDLADPDNISKTSTNESVDQDEARKFSTSDSVDLDTQSITSTTESVEHETVSKMSVTESAEQETVTLSTAESIDADVASKMSTIESAEPGTISKSSTRGSIDQDIISKSSASESGEPDAVSRTSVSESGEPEFQSKTSYSEYEEAEGITRTSASEYEEADSISRTSISESGDPDAVSRTSTSDLVDETSKASMTATGTSVSATGEYTSKSSVSYSSEFDAESLSSTADLLTPKEEISFVSDMKAEPGVGESAKLEKDSPSGSPGATEIVADRPGSPAWEELDIEDHMQLTDEGAILPKDVPSKGDKEGTEADAESLFFSLYPEYQPGEVDESQEAAVTVTTDNPKVLCFRGQTQEQDENQEEIYMAVEKGEIPRDRDEKNKVSGKIHQLQHKLSQQKFQREDKEITELKGSSSQQSGFNSNEPQDSTKQKSQGISEQGGAESTSDPTRGKSLSDVSDSSTPSSLTSATNAKKTEHTISKKTDDLVCPTRQFGERAEALIKDTEVVAEVVTDTVQTESFVEVLSSGPEVGQEAMEVENKLEGNAKDRKTLVGKARDWIKGVTRIGSKKEETNDKMNEKLDGDHLREISKYEAKKPDDELKTDLEKTKSTQGTESKEVEAIQQSKEKKEPAVSDTSEQMKEKHDEQDGGSDSIDDQQFAEKKNTETDEMENIKNASKDAEIEAKVDKSKNEDIEEAIGIEVVGQTDESKEKTDNEKEDTVKEKAETEPTKEVPTEKDKGEDLKEQVSKEEGLFDIVGPEEELSDSVFKDDTGDENGTAKESDDTGVLEMKTEEPPETEVENLAETANPIENPALLSQKQQDMNLKDDTKEKHEIEAVKDAEDLSGVTREVEVEKHEKEDSLSKESESSFVSVQEGIEPEYINVHKVSEEVEKQRTASKDELKSRSKRHDKSKSPSINKDGSPKTSRKEKDGKRESKKRRHRRRTKSQEDKTDIQMAVLQAADTTHITQEPKPEDVALPSDDFENEKEPQQKQNNGGNDILGKEQQSVNEKKDSEITEPQFADDAKVVVQEDIPKDTYSQETDAKDSQTSDQLMTERKKGTIKSSKEHKRHSRSRREKSIESKEEKHDFEKLEKDTQKIPDKPEESPLEKLRECQSQSPFTAEAATWSPRVARKERKSSRKSTDHKREGQSSDRPKVPKDKKDEKEHLSEVCDDVSLKKSPKTSKEIKSKKPELSLIITEPREDTPIPSPKLEPQPLLQTLTFPEGVSKPISPVLPIKELKFPPGVSKPVSPLPEKIQRPLIIQKPTPEPLTLEPCVETVKPVSPLKTLSFPEGIAKPVSPLPKNVPQPIPKPASSSLDVEKPLGYPAKPVSPLKMLNFPEGITKPVSPLPPPTQKSAPLVTSSVINEQENEKQTLQPLTTTAKVESGETIKSVSPLLKKPRPLIIIPKPELSSSETLETPPEPAKPVSPLKTLKFPEGISKPVSPLIKKTQQALFKLDSHPKTVEKTIPEPLKLKPDSTKTDIPMKAPVKPVSPLRTITFPPGISKPVSPAPQKVSQPLFKPIQTSKPIPPPHGLQKPSDEMSESDALRQEKKADVPAQSSSQTTKTLTTLTFPEGVSKPVSPLPQKKTFSTDVFKSTPPPTKGSLPSSEVSKTSSAPEKSSPSESLKSTIEAIKPSIPSEFFKTVHAEEKTILPSSELLKTLQAVTKSSFPCKEFLQASESNTSQSPSTGRSSPVRTIKFPEGVSMPVSPLPLKGKPVSETSEAQKVQSDSSAIETSAKSLVKTPQETSTIFSFSQVQKQDTKTEELPKSPVSISTPLQKAKISENDNKPMTEPVKHGSVLSHIIRRTGEATSPVPIKIKHTVDFPSDVFPCAKSSSPVSNMSPSPLIKPTSPGPKITSPSTNISLAETKPTSPLPKVASPIAKVVPKPPSPTPESEVAETTEVSSPVPQSQKSELKYPRSILSTRLRSSPEIGKAFSPDRSYKMSSEVCKSPLMSHSPDQSLKTQSDSVRMSTMSFSPDRSPKMSTESTKSTISQTHLTYSEVSKRFTPSPRLSDEMSKEISPTPPMTPPPDQEQPTSPKGKSKKVLTTTIQTLEARSAAKYSRGEETQSSQKGKREKSPIKESEESAKITSHQTTEKGHSVSGSAESHNVSPRIHRLREAHQITPENICPSPDVSRSRNEGSHSPKDGSQSPHGGSDTSSKKLRRRKRR